MIKVNVLFENHTRPVLIDEYSTPSDLIQLAFTGEDNSIICPIPLFQGKILDPSLSLKCQDVGNDDTIVVYQNEQLAREIEFHKQLRSSSSITSFSDKVKSLMKEALKVNDNAYNTLESNPIVTRAFHNMILAHQSHISALPNESFQTVLPPKPERPSTETIQCNFFQSEVESDCEQSDDEQNSSEDLGLSYMFESIEEAGKYIRKHSFTQWTW